ncbi:AbrB family transcriptional regulator [Candidatus Pacearchaeota archaeon CG10_big_fil_rev_8_21_14_0_10_30_48]|nr:MAG: AbrB family transcriptional regulator [Candidatus Pacearchaeota archaeon CG10_big_fil_rev_8_21_14_0_10_30_48]
MQEEIREIRTVKITRKGQVSIPSAVRAKAGFEEGAKINVIAYDDRVELRPMKKGKLSEATMCYIMSEEALARNWDTPEEDEAWKDL